MDEQINMWFVGRVWNSTAFGVADAKMSLHIAAHYYPSGSQIPVNIPGTGPFKVILKVNDNIIRVVENIPVTVDPNNETEYNCVIENLPTGLYSLVASDSTPPPDGPLDVRGISAYNIVSPPYVTLNGSVNPLGDSVTVSFDYGLTTDYGYVAQYGVVNGYEPTLASLQLSSEGHLVPNTLYHYRIKAVTSGGTTVYGEDMTFSTLPVLPIVVTLPATDIS